MNLEEATRRFDLLRWVRTQRFKGSVHSKEWLADCPFCGAPEKFSVNPRQKKWRCFVCQIPCTLVDVIAAYEGSRHRALQVLYDGVGNRTGGLRFIPDFDLEDDDVFHRGPHWEPKPISPPDHFVPLTDHVAYTQRRAMCLDHLLALGVGYCTWGRYQDRLVFPVRRYPDGAWLYFQARAMWEKSEHVPRPYRRRDGSLNPDDYTKNLNPRGDDTGAVANANDVLLGLDLVVAWGLKHVALVEGPTDWAAVGPGAVASFGKSLSPHQLQLLVKAGVTDVDMMWDPDAWEVPTRKLPDGTVVPTGRPPPAQAASAQLSSLFDVRVVRFHRGTDPGDYSPADNALWRSTARSYGVNRLSYIS